MKLTIDVMQTSTQTLNVTKSSNNTFLELLHICCIFRYWAKFLPAVEAFTLLTFFGYRVEPLHCEVLCGLCLL